MNGEEHWKCYKQGHRDGRAAERERCAAELAVCRWLAPSRMFRRVLWERAQLETLQHRLDVAMQRARTMHRRAQEAEGKFMRVFGDWDREKLANELKSERRWSAYLLDLVREADAGADSLIDEDPLPDGYVVDLGVGQMLLWCERLDEYKRVSSYKAAVRLAWALEQGLELDQ